MTQRKSLKALVNENVFLMGIFMADGVWAEMLWLGDGYPNQLGQVHLLNEPKQPDGPKYHLLVPEKDKAGEPIQMMHSKVFLPYVRSDAQEN